REYLNDGHQGAILSSAMVFRPGSALEINAAVAASRPNFVMPRPMPAFRVAEILSARQETLQARAGALRQVVPQTTVVPAGNATVVLHASAASLEAPRRAWITGRYIAPSKAPLFTAGLGVGPRPATNGSWQVQLATKASAEQARALLARTKQLHPPLATRRPWLTEVVRKGTSFYRARYTGFATREAAISACHAVRSADLSCLVVSSPLTGNVQPG
ncbi:MAG: SPOR domain-containing protein, partial [Rhodanobacter sp.]